MHSQLSERRTPLFDAYVFVDWSAQNKRSPERKSADAIWSGWYLADAPNAESMYHRTRHEACEHVTELLLMALQKRLRVLVGFDFAYGYPTGFSASHGQNLGKPAWQATWLLLSRLIRDNHQNESNRFEVAGQINRIVGADRDGPFWGCPANKTYDALKPKSPGFPWSSDSSLELRRLRRCEQRLRGVNETWKLFGAGSVGGQALVGIPYIHRLRYDTRLSEHSAVWPFETGFAERLTRSSGASIIHAEIWPGVINERVARVHEANVDLIKDQIQVTELCSWARELDLEGRLVELMARPCSLTDTEYLQCVGEEGWILGAR